MLIQLPEDRTLGLNLDNVPCLMWYPKATMGEGESLKTGIMSVGPAQWKIFLNPSKKEVDKLLGDIAARKRWTILHGKNEDAGNWTMALNMDQLSIMMVFPSKEGERFRIVTGDGMQVQFGFDEIDEEYRELLPGIVKEFGSAK